MGKAEEEIKKGESEGGTRVDTRVIGGGVDDG